MGILSGWRAPVELSAAAPPVSPVPTFEVASPWADRSNLEAVTLAGLFDALESIPLSRAQAVKLPAVARGRDLIAVSIGRLPIVAATGAGRLANQPNFLQQPERGRARVTTLTWTVDDLLFNGAAYWRVSERASGDNRPSRFEWMPYALCEHDTAGQLITFKDEPIARPDDVVRFDGPHEGILSRGTTALRDARRLFCSFSRQADNPIPTVELHQIAGDTLTDDEIDKMIDRFLVKRKGENGSVGYTNASIQMNVHGMPAEQLLIEALNRVDLEVARTMGLPAWAIDAQVSGSSLTYSNVPSRARELIDYTLGGYIDAIAGRLSLDDVLPRGTWADILTDPLTDGDFGERMADYKLAQDAGIYTTEQLQSREFGVPPEGTE